MELLWAGAIAVAILLYVVLDGFDLGIGMLFPFAQDERERQTMMNSIAPVWDGNETWLIVTGASLFAAFPTVYAILLPAFYLPLMLMLMALILRGVAFEFRHKTPRMRWVWDTGFVGGSYVATFCQGAAVGAIVACLPVEGTRFAGDSWSWLGAFPLVCGLGLCLGYALLGATWLAAKTEGRTRDLGYEIAPKLLAGVIVFLAIAFVQALFLENRIMERWLDRPALLIFPILGNLAAWMLVRSLRRRLDPWPFRCVAVIFVMAFGTLAVSFWPYMVPYSITIEQAAAPPASLSFLFWGAGLFVYPLTLFYTGFVYWVFRGKVGHDAGYH